MHAVLFSVLVTLGAGERASLPTSVPDTLHCRVGAEASPRRCSVAIPAGRAVRACSSVDAAASHCDKKGDGRYVAWVVSRGGAKCEISRKRSDWTRRVTVKRSKKTAGPQAVCDLYLVLK